MFLSILDICCSVSSSSKEQCVYDGYWLKRFFSLRSTKVNFLCHNIFYLFITFFTFRGYSRCFLIFDQPWNIPQIDEVILPFYLNGIPYNPIKNHGWERVVLTIAAKRSTLFRWAQVMISILYLFLWPRLTMIY